MFGQNAQLYSSFIILFLLFIVAPVSTAEEDALEIGSRRELFTDGHLIDKIDGSVELQVQQPVPKGVSLVADKPWEGNTSAYFTVFQDDDKYRMYYRGSHWLVDEEKAAHREVTCYAESSDGITWTKPELGLYEFDGSKKNNIVWNGPGTHCFTPFKDTNPNCNPDARYKALTADYRDGKRGLLALQSPDGIHWKLIQDEHVITEGYFDSQNLAFWDSNRMLYVDYHRTFINGVRSIMTCTSKDFVNWTKPVLLEYQEGSPNEHLYTNAVRLYDRAPHIYIGFPTRYLPNEGSRVEPLFMSSRDSINFHRYSAVPVVPESAPADRKGNRSNYMANGLLDLKTEPKHMSVYATEAYYEGPDNRIRRFQYRKDGFVALTADKSGGIVTTRLLKTTGGKLYLNYQTSEGGHIKVDVLDKDDELLPGMESVLVGDSIDEQLIFGKRRRTGLSAGVYRLRFSINNASVYAFRFSDK